MPDPTKSTGQSFFPGMEPERQGRSVALRRFEPLILRDFLRANDEHLVSTRDLQARDSAHQVFRDWHAQLSQPSFANQTETNLEQAFNARCLAALGYRPIADSPTGDAFSLAVKQALPGGKIADVVLGQFPDPSQITPKIRVVVELKGPAKRLDRAPANQKTPVEQALGYLSTLDSPNLWAIVTNMVEFRLYHKTRSNVRALVFRLPDLSDPKEFGQFYAAFRAENLLPLPTDIQGYSKWSTLAMLEESEQRQQKVGTELYEHYRNNRIRLIETIRQDPLCDSFDEALAAAQLLLDRILFIAFAEDRGLLDKRTIELCAANKSAGIGPWKAFQSLFAAVNTGDPETRVPGYNGSLFKPHKILDHPSFRLPRDPWATVFRKIGDFDYSDQVNVTVLGHIFEQSITDIERLRSDSQKPTDSPQESAEPTPKKAAKTKKDSARKKHGVYYTDDSVTEYLVSAALDPVWADADSQARAPFPDPDSPAAIRARIAALDALTLCDPACGSGAFLVAALKWFVRHRQDLLDALRESEPMAPEWDLVQRSNEAMPFTDYERTPAIVLKNNLYGVDLSAESVEITRLALWLQTATEGQKLTDLSHNIRHGNSVVDDPAALPDAQKHMAFDWRSEFPDVFARGGFDVVVGNPPYVRQETLGTTFKDFARHRYQAFHGMADLYVYFYERGLDILKPGGHLAYIVTNKWMKAGYGEPLRTLFAERAWVRSVMDFGHAKQFFADADVFPCFLVVQKPDPARPAPEETAVAVLNRDDVDLKQLPAQIENVTILVSRSRFGAPGWSLESPQVAALMEKIRRNGVPLAEYAGVKPYRGVLTGFNEAFLIDTPTRDRLIAEDPRSAEIIKPYLRGQDIKRWVPEWAGLWMIAIASSGDKVWPWSNAGENAEEILKASFPAIYGHLNHYRNQLHKRQDKGRFYWELRSCAYWDKFASPKIMYQEISPFALLIRNLIRNRHPSDDRFFASILDFRVTISVFTKRPSSDMVMDAYASTTSQGRPDDSSTLAA